MLTELTSPGKALTAMRFHILLRGEEVTLKEERKARLKELEARAGDVIPLPDRTGAYLFRAFF